VKSLIKNITKKEWHWLVLISLILLVIVFAPTVFGIMSTPPGFQFTGLKIPDEGDYWTFFSRLEQSRQGNVFHQYLYSTEPMPKVLFFPVWSMMGLIGGGLGLTSQQAFYFFQLILIPILVISLFLLISQFIKERAWKIVTLVATVFATGSDWLFWPMFKNKFNWLGFDLGLPDTHILTGVYHSPHIIFLLIFICWIFIALLELERTGRTYYSWLAGIFSMLLFLSHPYQVIPLLGTVTLYFFYQSVIKNQAWLIKKLLPFIFLNLLTGAYLFYLWSSFDVIKSWNQHNDVLNNLLNGPAWVLLLLSSYSIFGLLALFKIYHTIKNKKAGDYLLLIIWTAVIIISLSLPIQWKGKMILGLSIPITILGSMGLKFIWEKVRSFLLKSIFIWLIVVLTLPSGSFLIGHHFSRYQLASQTLDTEFYLPKDVIAGLIWLRTIPDDAIVLSWPAYSMMVPAYSGRKVYAGFIYETLNYENKFRATVQFFTGGLGREFLTASGIEYVLIDSSLTDFNKEYLALVFSNPAVKIFRVIK